MSKIAIVSDLHLGDASSRLSTTAAQGAGRSFEEHIEEVFVKPLLGGDNKISYLVLNGDTFDFSLQGYERAFNEASEFFRTVASAGLCDELILIPGNHDHNIWDMVQHQTCVIRRVEQRRSPKEYPHLQAGLVTLGGGEPSLSLPGVTAAEEGPRYGDIFLKGLFDANGPSVPMSVVYPNLFVKPPEGRPVLVTHGHFFQLPWTLLTTVFPRSLKVNKGLTLMQLEQLNAPLTELGWKGLGQAGNLTDVTRAIYDEVPSGEMRTLRCALDEGGAFVDDNVFVYQTGWTHPIQSGKEAATDKAIALAKEWLMGLVMKSLDHKNDNLYLDNEENRARIATYASLARSQYHDITSERLDTMPGHLVFGHTHVPILPDHGGLVEVQRHGLVQDMRVYNSGGWHGDAKAVALTIDEDGTIDAVHF